MRNLDKSDDFESNGPHLYFLLSGGGTPGGLGPPWARRFSFNSQQLFPWFFWAFPKVEYQNFQSITISFKTARFCIKPKSRKVVVTSDLQKFHKKKFISWNFKNEKSWQIRWFWVKWTPLVFFAFWGWDPWGPGAPKSPMIIIELTAGNPMVLLDVS